LKIDLPATRQLLIIDAPGQLIERQAHALRPLGAGLGRHIVEQMIEAVLAQTRRLERPQLELRVEILLEEGGELVVFTRLLGRAFDVEPHRRGRVPGDVDLDLHAKSRAAKFALATSPDRTRRRRRSGVPVPVPARLTRLEWFLAVEQQDVL